MEKRDNQVFKLMNFEKIEKEQNAIIEQVTAIENRILQENEFFNDTEVEEYGTPRRRIIDEYDIFKSNEYHIFLRLMKEALKDAGFEIRLLNNGRDYICPKRVAILKIQTAWSNLYKN